MTMGARNFVFCTQASYQLGEALRVGGRQEGTIPIALAVALDQVRETLRKEGKEHSCGAGFQKERVGEDVVSSGIGSGAIVTPTADSRASAAAKACATAGCSPSST